MARKRTASEPVYIRLRRQARQNLLNISAPKARKKHRPTRPTDPEIVLSLIAARVTNAKALSVRSDGQITYKKARDVVDGYRKLLDNMKATHFFTFMPGCFIRPETLAANIIKFCCRLDRKVLGKKWHKCKSCRLRLVGFLEKPDDTPHYHAIVRVSPYAEDALAEFGDKIWNTLMPRGKFEGEPIKGNARRYSTKDLHHVWSPEHVVIYKPMPRKK